MATNRLSQKVYRATIPIIEYHSGMLLCLAYTSVIISGVQTFAKFILNNPVYGQDSIIKKTQYVIEMSKIVLVKTCVISVVY